MYLFLGHSLGSKLQKIQKISTEFASAFHNNNISLHFMPWFPLPADLGLQLQKGSNLTSNVLNRRKKKRSTFRTTLYYLEEH